MTDTRKEFEEWYLKEYGNDMSEYLINGKYLHEMVHMQFMGWQACQSLNDKRIEQLLAVIAKKDEALIKACELIEKFSLQVYNGSDCLRVYESVELQPSDVDLSDIGYISEDGEEVFLTMGLPLDAESCGVPVNKLYTIKTK